jgi:hypothetical protein
MHEIVPKRFSPKLGLGRAAKTLIPIMGLTAQAIVPLNLMKLQSIAAAPANFVGGVVENTVLKETEAVFALQAPGAANVVKLPAAETIRPDGFWTDADIEIISGPGVGQKNRITGYTLSTKVADVLALDGSPTWRVATTSASVARLKTRHFLVSKDDYISFAMDFTIGTGTAGVDAFGGVEIEFDESVDI